MPFIGATLDSVSVDETSMILSLVGTNFGEVQSPASDIACRINGSGDAYISVDSVDSWGNLAAVGSYLVALPAGVYDVWIYTSDNEQVFLDSAFTIAAAATVGRASNTIRVAIYVG